MRTNILKWCFHRRPVWSVGVGWVKASPPLLTPVPCREEGHSGLQSRDLAGRAGRRREGAEPEPRAGTLTTPASAPQPAPVFVTGLRPVLSTTPLRWGC